MPYSMMKCIIKFEQTGSRFAQRDVIGRPEIINNFTPELLLTIIINGTGRISGSGNNRRLDVADMEKGIIKNILDYSQSNNPATKEFFSVLIIRPQ